MLTNFHENWKGAGIFCVDPIEKKKNPAIYLLAVFLKR